MKHKGCGLQHLSMGAFADVTVVLVVRQSISNNDSIVCFLQGIPIPIVLVGLHVAKRTPDFEGKKGECGTEIFSFLFAYSKSFPQSG